MEFFLHFSLRRIPRQFFAEDISNICGILLCNCRLLREIPRAAFCCVQYVHLMSYIVICVHLLLCAVCSLDIIHSYMCTPSAVCSNVHLMSYIVMCSKYFKLLSECVLERKSPTYLMCRIINHHSPFNVRVFFTPPGRISKGNSRSRCNISCCIWKWMYARMPYLCINIC